MKTEDKFYIDLVGQIMDGFSTLMWRGRPIYIKHHNFRNQALISTNFEKYKQENIISGILTEEEAIREAMVRGDWTEEDENFIKESESKIDALVNAAKAIKIPSHKEKQLEIVKDLREKIKEKQEFRSDIVAHTAENMAYIKTNSRFMELILFEDKGFTKPLTESEEYSTDDFLEIRDKQVNIYTHFNDDNIAKSVLRDFFNVFMPFADSPYDMFGKPAMELTVFQLKLITYSKTFKNVFENVRDIPELIRYDPDALIEYVKVQQEEQSGVRATGRMPSDPDARTFFNANKEDLEKLKSSGEKVVSLGELVKKHGGSMDMNEMMKAHGLE
jgi:hypothetical protein